MISRIWRPWLRASVGVAVSAAFLAVTTARVDIDLLGEAWASVSYASLAVALAISAAEVFVRAIRWRLLLAPSLHIGLGSSLGFLSIGHLANAILPARLGDVARAVLTGGHTHSSRATVLGTIAVERIADAALLGLAATAGVLVGYGALTPAVVALAALGAAAFLIAAAFALLLRRQAVQLTRVGGLLATHGRRFVAGGAALRTPGALARVVSLTVASFGLAVTIMFIVTDAVGLSMPIWQAALVVAAVTLSTAIPAGPASIGTYEFAGTMVLTAMGHPAEASLLAVGLVHMIATLVPAGMGLASMWAMGITPIRWTAPQRPSIDHA